MGDTESVDELGIVIGHDERIQRTERTLEQQLRGERRREAAEKNGGCDLERADGVTGVVEGGKPADDRAE